LEGGKWLLTAGSPLVTGAITLASGYFGNWAVPLPYLIAASAIVFAMTALGLISFSAWKERITPKNKLFILGAEVNWDDLKDSSGASNGIEYVSLVIRVQNKAIFPLSFSIAQFDLSIESRIPKDKAIKGSAIIQANGGQGWYRSATIELNITPLRNLTGKLDFTIAYGRPGNEKYRVSDSSLLTLVYNKDKNAFLIDSRANVDVGVSS
jgi:hypothetical protein